MYMHMYAFDKHRAQISDAAHFRRAGNHESTSKGSSKKNERSLESCPELYIYGGHRIWIRHIYTWIGYTWVNFQRVLHLHTHTHMTRLEELYIYMGHHIWIRHICTYELDIHESSFKGSYTYTRARARARTHTHTHTHTEWEVPQGISHIWMRLIWGNMCELDIYTGYHLWFVYIWSGHIHIWIYTCELDIYTYEYIHMNWTYIHIWRYTYESDIYTYETYVHTNWIYGASYMNQTCPIYERVQRRGPSSLWDMSRIWMSLVTYVWKSHATYKWMSHVIHEFTSHVTYEWMSHVTYE